MQAALRFSALVFLGSVFVGSGCAGGLTSNQTPAIPSATGSVAGVFKSSAAKAKEIVTPKPRVAVESDPISLANKPIPPGADLYISMARLQERSGNIEGAAGHYEKALKLEPTNLKALLGYAHLRDREGKLADASRLYERAAAKHPKEGTALNDLGMCYARQKMFDKSAAALAKAVQLEPGNKLFRNNIAMVLVEQRRLDEAFRHLTAVHSEPVAQYNLGFMLNQAGDRAAAAEHFRLALAKDPSMTAARDWLARLEAPAGQPALTAAHSATPRLASAQMRPSRPMNAQPDPQYPVRFPQQQPQADLSNGAAMPPLPDGISGRPSEEGPDLQLLPAVDSRPSATAWR